MGDRYGFDWLRRAASSLPTDTAWDKLAVTAIVDDFYGHQSELVAAVLNGQSGDGEPQAAQGLAGPLPFVADSTPSARPMGNAVVS